MVQRIVTGIIAGCGFILMLILGGWPFGAFIALLVLIAYYELVSMAGEGAAAFGNAVGAIAVLLIVLQDRLNDVGFHSDLSDIVIGLSVLLLIATVFSRNAYSFSRAAVAFFAAFYVGLGFHYLVAARDESLVSVLFILILIWTTDSGAYFVGRAFGKHKLAPHISPNKTIEGGVGGILCAIAVAFIFQAIHTPPGLGSPERLVLVALVISVFGQLGDLAESALKRHFGVKDSGKLLPGHGGLLDRCDSWIFLFPVLHIFQIV